MDMKLEVVVIPVTDVDRAKAFYEKLDWRLDIHYVRDCEHRVVQFTPPGSEASIHRQGDYKVVADKPTVVVLANAGHWILEEKPKETTVALLNLL